MSRALFLDAMSARWASQEKGSVAQVVVEVAPAHLDRPFDYRVPERMAVRIGQRVRVPFSGRVRPGWVVGLGASQPDREDLLPVRASDGPWTWFDEADLALYRWVADRYGATLAAVLRHAVPSRVAAVDAEAQRWPDPPAWDPATRPPGVGGDRVVGAWRPYAASALLKAAAGTGAPGAYWWRPLHGDDAAALACDLVARALAAGSSALVLTADPGGPLARLALATAGTLGADLRGADDTAAHGRARYTAVLRCRTGHARVAVGGRAAVFAPLRDLGLVIVEDEANPAYKERRAPRHHAREVALTRARMAGATAVLTGDLPSAALWRLLTAGHVRPAAADRAVVRERAPRVDVVDLGDPRPGARRARLSDVATRALSATVHGGGAAVVLAARRGEGTALSCSRCGRRRACPVCDAALRVDPPAALGGRGEEPSHPAVPLHGATAVVEGAAPADGGHERWACATCGWAGRAFACPACGAEATAPRAAGAARLATELARSYPGAEVVRMEGFDAHGPRRRPGIAVMTRGSVVARPAWLAGREADVVVVPDADALLARPLLSAAEDALRLWFAAGSWTRHVVLQTREPGNPAVQALVRWDPEGFWRAEAGRRAELAWPPHASLLTLGAPPDHAEEVAAAVRGALPAADLVLGPDPDGALLVKSARLRGTLDALTPLRQDWGKRSVRVRVDVDPVA